MTADVGVFEECAWRLFDLAPNRAWLAIAGAVPLEAEVIIDV